MFTNLLAESVDLVNGKYPGGSSLDNPVPPDVAYYLPPYGYGIALFLVLAVALFAVTRLNIDR